MKRIYVKLIYGCLLLILGFPAISTSLYYQNGYRAPNQVSTVRPYIVPYGSISHSDIDWAATLLRSSAYMGGFTMGAMALGGNDFFTFRTYSLKNQSCPVGTKFSCVVASSSCTADERLTAQNQAVTWINSIISQKPSLGDTIWYDLPATRVTESWWECRDRTAPYNWVYFNMPISVEILPEPTDKSVCSLGSDVSFNFSSTVLDVNGISSTKTLPISCTSGDAQNYQLKLIATGDNVTNGRLNFKNGVSGQVSLNGTQIQTNGTGIQLNNLTTSTISVGVTLYGTASVSGVSKATGILVLDAL